MYEFIKKLLAGGQHINFLEPEASDDSAAKFSTGEQSARADHFVGGNNEINSTAERESDPAKNIAVVAMLESEADDPRQQLESLARTEKSEELMKEDTELTPKRKKELEEEIAGTAEFFNNFGEKWYMAGGTGLELASGGLTRDHEDVDVSMYPEDLVSFYDYATRSGYTFKRPLTAEEVASYKEIYGRDPEVVREDPHIQKTWITIKDGNELSKGHNAFAKPTNSEGALLANGFEVIALKKDPVTGGTVFEADADIVFPPEVYGNPHRYIAINGEEVPLTPKEVQLLYKIYEGRQKDVEDIGRTLPTLDDAEWTSLEKLLKSAHVSFTLSDGTTANNLDTAVNLASPLAIQDREKILAEVKPRFNQTIEPIYTAAQESTTQEEYLQNLAQEFSPAILDARAEYIAKIADFMFVDPKPTREAFDKFSEELLYEKYHSDFMGHRTRSFKASQRWKVEKQPPVDSVALAGTASEYVQLIGRYKDIDLPPVVTEFARRDGDQELKLYGLEHNDRERVIKKVVEEMTAAPADVYFVELFPKLLPKVYECIDADDAFNKFGESGYIAWLAHEKGKEVRTWDNSLTDRLEDGYEKLGDAGLEPILGSFVGSGMLHIIDREGAQTGSRANQFIKTIKQTAFYDEVSAFFGKHGIAVNEDTIARVMEKYSGKAIGAMTKEEVSRMFEPYGDGPVNKANLACNEPRDDHAITEMHKAKQEGVSKIVVIAGQDHTRLWQRPLEAMYPQAAA